MSPVRRNKVARRVISNAENPVYHSLNIVRRAFCNTLLTKTKLNQMKSKIVLIMLAVIMAFGTTTYASPDHDRRHHREHHREHRGHDRDRHDRR